MPCGRLFKQTEALGTLNNETVNISLTNDLEDADNVRGGGHGI